MTEKLKIKYAFMAGDFVDVIAASVDGKFYTCNSKMFGLILLPLVDFYTRGAFPEYGVPVLTQDGKTIGYIPFNSIQRGSVINVDKHLTPK